MQYIENKYNQPSYYSIIQNTLLYVYMFQATIDICF